MKQVDINVGKDKYIVNIDIWSDDLKTLSDKRETSMLFAVAINRMIKSGHSKELVMKIVDEFYESRL